MDSTSSTAGLGPEMTASTLSKIEQLKSSTANMTSYLNPSLSDLLMLFPRMLSRAGSFALITIPETIDNLIGQGNGGRVIAEATRDGVHNIASAALASAALPGNTQGIAEVAATGVGAQVPTVSLREQLWFQQIRKFGGVFTYALSKWGVSCFVVVSLYANLHLRHRF